MDQDAPTRTNLLARRAQIKLAQSGVDMLRGKREALLSDLIDAARELQRMQDELFRRGRDATAALAMARAVRSTAEVRAAAGVGRRDLNVRVVYHPSWGVELADVEHHDIVRGAEGRGTGRVNESPHVLEAAEAAERLLEQLLTSAPAERNIRLLGEEVKQTNRRINALEERLLPRLEHSVRRIRDALEEREREEVFRLKRVKKKHEARGRAG